MTLLNALAPDERPRERLMRLGANSLTDAELLALLVGSGIRGKHVITLASELLEACQGVAGLPRMSLAQLRRRPGIGKARACLLAAAFEIGRRAGLAQLRNGEPLCSSGMVRDYCRSAMSHLQIEHCRMIMLDSQNRVIAEREVSRGTLYETPIYPREVARMALEHHAASIILVHNHPSGVALPSQADLYLTRTLAQALGLIDVILLDHLIVAGPQVISLAELGHLNDLETDPD